MNRALLIAAMMAGAAALLLRSAGEGEEEGDAPYEAPDLFDQANAFLQEWTDMNKTNAAADPNVYAFLGMLRVSEGTAGPDGYRTLVGGSLFDSFADHPRTLVWLPNLGIKSSAAGAFQILRATWDGVRGKLGLPDFSPLSQDAAAIELIRQRGALADVRAGRFAVAIQKCRKEWASLPGAGYGQRENSLARLELAYRQAGGVVA
jgi:muramidase (phage lysozyme)